MSDRSRDRLAGECESIIGEMEAAYSTYLSDIDCWWSWYEAEPQTRVKSFPWIGASNLVVPVIRTHADNVAARYFNRLFGTGRLWIGRSDNEEFARTTVTPLTQLLNGLAGKDFDIESPVQHWLHELTVVGQSILELSWRTKTGYRLMDGERRNSPMELRLSRGAYIEHIPRHQILWDMALPIQAAPVVIKECPLTATQTRAQCRKWGVPDDTIASILKHPAGRTTHSGSVREGMERREGRDTPGIHYDFRELYLSWPLMQDSGMDSSIKPEDVPPGRPETPWVVTLHRDTNTVVRVTPYPYLTDGWLFFESHLRVRPGRGSAVGLAKMLEHAQRGETTMMNQAIDAVTRSNSVWGASTDPTHANFEFAPNKVLIQTEQGAFAPINAQHSVMPEISLFQVLQQIAEKTSGINEPQMGRETPTGGHPAPATSTMALLQESSLLFSFGLRNIRRTMQRMGREILSLYRQFETDRGKVASLLGEADATPVIEWMFPSATQQTPVADFSLDLHAMSETMNPEAEAKRAVLTMQATQNFYAQLLQLTLMGSNPQTPPLAKAVITEAIEAQAEAFRSYLRASEIDDIEAYVTANKETTENALARLDPAALSQLTGGQPPLDGQPAPEPSGPGGGVEPDGGAGGGMAGGPPPPPVGPMGGAGGMAPMGA
jgi:hypothetical protein